MAIDYNDPRNWEQVDNVNTFLYNKGPELRLRTTAPATLSLYFQEEGQPGKEVPVSFGTEHVAKVDSSVGWRFADVQTDGPIKVYLYVGANEQLAFEADTEIFTDIDNLPQESGAMAEITRATRLFEMQRLALLDEMREEARRIQAESGVVLPVDPDDPEVIDDADTHDVPPPPDDPVGNSA